MNFKNVSYQVPEAFTAKLTTGKDIKITKGAVITVNYLINDAGDITNQIDVNSVHLCENRGKELTLYKNLDYTTLNFNSLIEVYSFGWRQNAKREYNFVTI